MDEETLAGMAGSIAQNWEYYGSKAAATDLLGFLADAWQEGRDSGIDDAEFAAGFLDRDNPYKTYIEGL